MRSSRSSVSSLLRPARGGNVRSTLRVVSCFRSGGASRITAFWTAGRCCSQLRTCNERLILRIRVSPGWEHSRVQPVVEAGHREIVAVCGEPASQQPHRKRVRPLQLQGSERIREAIREVVEELRNVPRRRLADEVVLPEQPETSYSVRVSAFRQVPPELVRTDRARMQAGQQRSAHLVIRVGDGSPAQLLP